MINNKEYPFKDLEKYILAKQSDTSFASNVESKKPSFTLMMPPPNVTGYLHMGHALVTTLQDTLARYKRMQGFDVLWQAGVDHAGIATQMVVERQLEQKNIKRTDLGREKFIAEVLKWKDTSTARIKEQLKRIGSSCDFSYFAFTMDEHSIEAVTHAFIKLYQAGLIYQDYRLTNWDCKFQTAISDLEVENKEVKGKFYYLRYYLEGSKDYLVVGTTRPETLFGDTALAINESDTRYKHLIGKNALVPIINRKIKIIADSHADPEKGSGVVKITPAHDFNDFEVGKRHNLEFLNILNQDGTLNNATPSEYIGLTVQKARVTILQHLKELDLIEKIDDAIVNIPYGDRSGTIIEPLLTKQWFLNAKELAKEAIKVVKTGKTQFIPENWENLYFEWMNNIQPWCISRQLWWGHRLPVYYGEDNTVFVAKSLAEAQAQAANHYKKTNIKLKQDEDVLDTWFSSALWPFLTLGWPANTAKLAKYYPTDVLVTAFDIIFFWVARMLMFGTFFMKQIPFKKVYIHALVRDSKGQKMSKSKGNVIDPLDIMEKYGTDALRFTLLYYSGQGRDIALSEQTIEGYRNFVTKIWNSFKFSLNKGCYFNNSFNPELVTLDTNKWILNKLKQLSNEIPQAYDNYKFNEIAILNYNFIWKNYCDWYLELVKPILNDSNKQQCHNEIQETMGFVLDGMLKILHPLMPFITEYLFNVLHKKEGLAYQKFPTYNFPFFKEDTNLVINFISKIRSLRADLNIPYSTKLEVFIEKDKPSYLIKNTDTILNLAKLSEIKYQNLLDSQIKDVVNGITIGIPLEGVLDIAKEVARLSKKRESLLLEHKVILEKLENETFTIKAPQEIVLKFKNRKLEIQKNLQKITNILEKLQ
ncbi:Valine--tRNA ligase [Candidatus Hepatincola sp. Pdp]